MQNTTKKLTIRAELREITVSSDIASQLFLLARDARSGDIERFAAAKSAVYGAIGRVLHGEISRLDADAPYVPRLKRLLAAREKEIDLNFILDADVRAACLRIPQQFETAAPAVEAEPVAAAPAQPDGAPVLSPSRASECAVIAGDVIVAVGATRADAVKDYAATGIEVRSDGDGGWEAISTSDLDWQPVQFIRISPELADHIRQHGAPDSWDTIDGVAHLEREAA